MKFSLKHLTGICVILSMALPLSAQNRPLLPGEQFDNLTELYHLRRLPRDPLVSTSYYNGLQALEADDVTLGLETLQSVLDDSSDFFFHEDLKLSGSLLSRIEESIQKHREDYERLYGVEAQQLLEDALKSQQLDAIQKVVRRFSQTDAGAKAIEHLAQAAWNIGDYGMAARLYERLARHSATKNRLAVLGKTLRLLVNRGQSRQAVALVSEFADLFGQSSASNKDLIASSPEKFIEQYAAKELEGHRSDAVYEWHSAFGGENHSASTQVAPAVIDREWAAPTIDQWDFSQLPSDLKQKLLNQSQQSALAIEERIRSNSTRVTLPTATPLIVDNLVIARGNGTIKAFNLDSGELVWASEALIEPTFNYLNQASHSEQSGRDRVREEMRELFFSQRNWRDLTSSAITTDGLNVYAISDCQLVGSVKPNLLIQNTTEHPLLPQRRNRLTAYSLDAEGKVVWTIGQSSMNVRELEERDIYFLGAPLSVNDHLYVLGEERGQIQIFELDPTTGTVLWSLGLLNPEKDLLIADKRRMAGLTPSYAAGLLICPTGEGVVTAIDPIRRSVVWSHQHMTEMQSFRNRMARMRGVRPQHQTIAETIREQLDEDRWFDSRYVVSGDHLVFTPPDDNELVCLDVNSGTEIWSIDSAADQSVYIAGATDDAILLVSRSEVSALRLADASPLWKQPVLIDHPSGRGVRMGDQYLLPMMTGDIAVIDIVEGRLITRLPLLSEKLAGNLAAANGTLVSQTGTEVTAFRSSELVIVELGKADIAEVDYLSLRGELNLQRGEIDAGITDLRKAAQLNPSERTMRILAWAMLSGLQHDFPRYSEMATEIESYLTGTAEKFEFRKTYAKGLQQTGDYKLALNYYLQLLADQPAKSPVNDITSRWAVSDERWVLARIKELFDSVDEKGPFATDLANWLISLESESQRLRFLKAIPIEHLDTKRILATLSTQEPTAETSLNHQAILLNLMRSTDSEVRESAMQQLASVVLKQGDGEAGERYLNLILQSANASPQTQAFVKQIKNNETFSETFLGVPHWPQQVEVEVNPRRVSSLRRFPIPLIGKASLELQGWSFMLDEMGSRVEVYDAHGRRRARIPTGLIQSRSISMGSVVGRYVEMHGHLAVVVLADRFLIIDLLSSTAQPQLIYKQNLITEQDNPYSSRSAIYPQQRPALGMRTFISRTPTNTLAGNVGPLSATVLCFGYGSDLIAIDPTTGQELWRRRDLTQGSEIFGDDEYVVIKPYEERTLQIYRAIDGSFIAERQLPEGVIPDCLARQQGDWGRCLPIRIIGEKLQWKLYDPVTDDVRWQTNYDIDTEWSSLNGEEIAFLNSDHTATIHSGMTGKKLATFELPIEFPSGKFHVLNYDDQWVFIVSEKTKFQMPRQTFSSTSELLSPPLDGVAIAVDKLSHEIQWSQKLENLSYVKAADKSWPVIFFANNHGQDAELFIVHRHTGKVLLDDAWSNDQPHLAWNVKTQPMSIELRFASRAIKLNCTDSLEAVPTDESK